MSQQYLSRIHQQPQYVCKWALTLPYNSRALPYALTASFSPCMTPLPFYAWPHRSHHGLQPSHPQKTTPPRHPTVQHHSLPPPSTTYHPINFKHQIWTGMDQERGAGWVTTASHMYPQVASAWSRPATMSLLYHSDGTKPAGPVILAMRFLEDIIW